MGASSGTGTLAPDDWERIGCFAPAAFPTDLSRSVLCKVVASGKPRGLCSDCAPVCALSGSPAEMEGCMLSCCLGADLHAQAASQHSGWQARGVKSAGVKAGMWAGVRTVKQLQSAWLTCLKHVTAQNEFMTGVIISSLPLGVLLPWPTMLGKL